MNSLKYLFTDYTPSVVPFDSTKQRDPLLNSEDNLLLPVPVPAQEVEITFHKHIYYVI